MNIALNLQPAVTQQAGIGRYTRELASHLLPILPAETKLRLDFFDFKREAVIPSPLAQHKGLHPVRWIPGGIAQKAWSLLNLPPYQWIFGKSDLYHFPNFLAPPQNKGKIVVSIHDLSFIRYPQYTEPRNLQYLKHGIARTASRADAIITISHFSAAEIVTFLDVPREKIYPIHLGIDPRFAPATEEERAKFRMRHQIQRPYILTVGTVEPRKNVPFLIGLFEQMKDYDGDLIIAGGLGWHYEPILARIKESSRTKQIRRIGFIPEEDLPLLYAQADAFILPSFYEGFGFPPLEAMACGTPVVSSTGGALAEVLQDGAILHDHYDPSIWQNSIMRLLQNPDERRMLAQKGACVAARYTWQKTAQETLDVYRKVLA